MIDVRVVSYVYFARTGERYVKIGKSTNPLSRVISLNAKPKRGSILKPFDLESIPAKCISAFLGDVEQELETHKRFAHIRVAETNEWYHATEELLAFAESVKIEDFENKMKFARNLHAALGAHSGRVYDSEARLRQDLLKLGIKV